MKKILLSVILKKRYSLVFKYCTWKINCLSNLIKIFDEKYKTHYTSKIIKNYEKVKFSCN